MRPQQPIHSVPIRMRNKKKLFAQRISIRIQSSYALYGKKKNLFAQRISIPIQSCYAVYGKKKKIIFPFHSIRSYPILNPWIQKKKNYFSIRFDSILSYPQPVDRKKKKIIFPIHPSGSYAQAVYERKKKYFTLPHPILSYPILSHLVRIAGSTAEGPEFDSRSSY